MSPLKAVIIDDEQHARTSLTSLLALYCEEVTVVGEASSIQEGIQRILSLHPDLVFLDIHIGREDGFELLDQVQSLKFQLIFTTAHSEFAVKAFRYNAIDFLLKPIEPMELVAAVEKTRALGYSESFQQQLAQLSESLQSKQTEKIVLSTAEGLNFICVEQIIHVEGDANYSTFYLHSGEKIMTSKNLKFYDDLLSNDTFFRAHQSHLVNMNAIKKIKTVDGATIELTNGAQIPLAKRRKEALLELLR